MRTLILSAISATCLLTTLPVEGGWVIRKGTIQSERDAPTMSAQEHYQQGLDALELKQWHEAVKQLRIVVSGFPGSRLSHEAGLPLGQAYYKIGDFELADRALSTYLKGQTSPANFEEAIRCKFHIAERYRDGAKRHLMGMEQMPRWAPSHKQALELYDQVVSSLPNSDLATQALYSKAQLLHSLRGYRDSVDTLNTLIRRFPKHELTPASYLMIATVYLDQCRVEAQNPDLLKLAKKNLAAFEAAFPTDPRVEQVTQIVGGVKELYAQGLFDTGRFYERIGKPKASVLYYKSAIGRFPETNVAQQCLERLKSLGEDPNSGSVA